MCTEIEVLHITEMFNEKLPLRLKHTQIKHYIAYLNKRGAMILIIKSKVCIFDLFLH